MYNSDKKILDLIDLLKYQKIIATTKDFCNKVGMADSTVTKINKDKAHFTPQHIENICEVFNVNANWIFGSEKNMFLGGKPNKTKDLTGNIADNVKRK